MKKNKINATSFLQLMLVSVNALLRIKSYVLDIFRVAPSISFIWCNKVAKIALFDVRKKMMYSLGAGLDYVSR